MTVTIKRVYEHPSPSDGLRILVDRVWPRGVSKQAAAVDEWLKDAGPSTELRTWFGHDPKRFAEFSRRYRDELRDSDALARIRHLAAERRTVTLVYSAKDTEHNQAVVLRELLT